jgi:hypothetical protein
MKNIKEFASVPKLIQVKLDEIDLVNKYGEPIVFYTYDVVSLSTYFEFFNARADSQFDNLGKMLKQLILLENGKPALADNEDLPIDIAAAAINKIGEILGKSQSRTSTPIPGHQPN